jgi:hypothetical protein
MMLYHGTNIDIQSIDLALCRPYKDFTRQKFWSRHRKWQSVLQEFMVETQL